MAGNVNPEKGALRARLEQARRALTPNEVAVLGGEVHVRLAAQAFFGQARVVALHAAQAFEVPTSPLFQALRRRGARCAYPRVVPGQRELQFHEVARLDELRPAGRLALLEPPLTAPRVPLEALELVLVPGVGFTPAGDRLGRGGGHYDATLAQAPQALRVGLAFQCSLVEALPLEAHDLRMHWLVTERQVFQCQGRAG